MTAYHHRHIITHTHCADLLVRRKILRLYFSSNTNSNPYFSSLNHNAPACRDAISCVSQAMTAYHHRHIITHTHCTDLLVRRKILRLYFCRLRFLLVLKLPSRSLLYAKVMQGESNGKVGKLCFHNFDTAEPKLTLCKVTHNPPLCRYNIMDMVYISSSGLSRCSFISLNCVGDSPVCALNCALRCATLE